MDIKVQIRLQEVKGFPAETLILTSSTSAGSHLPESVEEHPLDTVKQPGETRDYSRLAPAFPGFRLRPVRASDSR